MTAHAAEPSPLVPPMPERNPKALRAAIAPYTPRLLPDFDEHWKGAIADTYGIGPLPAFLARWWVEFSIARDPDLDAHVADLRRRAEAAEYAETKALLEEVSRIRYSARDLEPGQ
ncbi:DUF6247 family protein [Streptomyces thermolilacinus]|uniref:DUF6247 family protein n=1 Tax=Streptomyces thermolilacinus TaxID=285540 RepID=UPI00340CC364